PSRHVNAASCGAFMHSMKAAFELHGLLEPPQPVCALHCARAASSVLSHPFRQSVSGCRTVSVHSLRPSTHAAKQPGETPRQTPFASLRSSVHWDLQSRNVFFASWKHALVALTRVGPAASKNVAAKPIPTAVILMVGSLPLEEPRNPG